MCGRFTLVTPGDAIARRFNLPAVPLLEPRLNVAPSQLVAVIGSKASGRGRGLAQFRWGFVPHWANDARGARPINAKAETLAEKPTFRDSFRHRRCLIPADGFYEWRATPEGKQPLLFRRKDGEPMALAGLWDCWPGPTEKLFTCAIITTPANALVEPVHDRMPAVLPPDAWDPWLDPHQTDPSHLRPLLVPFPADQMECVPADPIINKPAAIA